MIIKNNDLPEGEALRTTARCDFETLAGSQVEGCSRIKPLDIDGCTERRGSLLIIEAKKMDETIEPPQDMALRALASKSGIIVLVVRITGELTSVGNESFVPISYRRYPEDAKDCSPIVRCTLSQFKSRYDDWLRAATDHDERKMQEAWDKGEK
jgi:hypothetical protein